MNKSAYLSTYVLAVGVDSALGFGFLTARW